MVLRSRGDGYDDDGHIRSGGDVNDGHVTSGKG